MPIQSSNFLQKEVRPLYRAILRNARTRFGDNDFLIEHLLGHDEVVGFVHGKKMQIVKQLTIDCGLRDNGRGGIFYQFFNKVAPTLKHTGEYAWREDNKVVELSERIVQGLFDYIDRFRLQGEFPDYDTYRDTLMGRFLRSGEVLRSSQLEGILARRDRFWKPLNFPKEWRNSEWFCFERTDIGICISCLSFTEDDAHVLVNMRTHYLDENVEYRFHYKGLASRDLAQEYLILELFREDTPHTFASFILRTGVYNEQAQFVSIGHHSYFAFRWAKYLTKQVVLLRREQLPDLPFEPREIPRNHPDYSTHIPLLIRRFLSNRNKNRFSMPGKLINRLEGGTYSLQRWFEDYFRGREPYPHLTATHGQYTVVYENQDESAKEKLVFAEIELGMIEPELSEAYSNTGVRYYYNQREWSGRAHWVGTRSLQCRLIARPDPTRGSLYLLLNLPKCDTLEELRAKLSTEPVYGIISGYSEKRQEAVAYRFGMAPEALLKRDDENNPLLKKIARELRNHPGMLRG